ncbi:hypothetical protein LTR95_006953 [Oleoguttula sp. CCFEE 5521]
MAKRPGVDWRAPTIITVAYTVGLAFAIGHHYFYASLAATFVDSSIFSQQHNLAIATFWQIFWRTLFRQNMPLKTADALAGLLGSIIDMASPRVWLASPLLVFIAAMAWLVPLAKILPPATLTVRLLSQTDHSLRSLGVPDFLNTSMGKNIYHESDADGPNSAPPGTWHWWTYGGPSNYVARIATNTALNGELPNLPSPATNATYVLSYPAPSVRCEEMPISVLSNWAPIMNCDPSLGFDGAADGFSACLTNPNDDYWWPYLAWVPSESGIVPFPNYSMTTAGDLPLLNLTEGLYYVNNLNLYLTEGSGFLGSYNSSAANLFIAAGYYPEGNDDSPPWLPPLNCSLYNSTYRVNFTFNAGVQEVSVLEVNLTNPISPFWETLEIEREDPDPPDIAVHMNYQALMEILGHLLVGAIARETTVFQTQILRTELAFTNDMRNINNQLGSAGLISTETNTSQWDKRPLARAVEDVFQNVTLPLFSRSEFLRIDDKSQTNVTITHTQNIYAYNWQRLWLSYGLAFLATLVVVIIGGSSLAIAGASYSNKLSTVLRVTGGDRINRHIDEADRAGNDPLPEYLGKAELRCRIQQPARDGVSDESLGIPLKAVATESSSMMERTISSTPEY